MFKILPTQKNPVQANCSLPKAQIGTVYYILYNIILFWSFLVKVTFVKVWNLNVFVFYLSTRILQVTWDLKF